MVVNGKEMTESLIERISQQKPSKDGLGFYRSGIEDLTYVQNWRMLLQDFC
jgi:hypothetical protein